MIMHGNFYDFSYFIKANLNTDFISQSNFILAFICSSRYSTSQVIIWWDIMFLKKSSQNILIKLFEIFSREQWQEQVIGLLIEIVIQIPFQLHFITFGHAKQLVGCRKIKRIRSSKAKEARPEIDECLLALEHTHAAHFVTVMANGGETN